MDRWTDGQMDIWTDRQTEKMDRGTDRDKYNPFRGVPFGEINWL